MKKLLIIEDNDMIRENLAELLEIAGYEVHQAVNGKEGIESAYKVEPDLILCDVMMPKIDGYGVLKILKEQEKTNDIPFIFLTAKGDQRDFRKGMTLGADDYIPKPFDDTELLETVKVRLERAAKAKKNKTSIARSPEVIMAELLSLAASYDTKTFEAKEHLFKTGQQPHWVYFIQSGVIKLSRSNDYGKEIITKMASNHDCIGYEAIIGDAYYEESAIALKDTVVHMIPKSVFLKIIQENSSYANFFTRSILQKVKLCQEQMLELAYSSVRKKVANALLRYAEVENEPQLKVSRDDLAALAGTAKETLVRTLKEFKEEGLIVVENRLIEIKDIKGLHQMSH